MAPTPTPTPPPPPSRRDRSRSSSRTRTQMKSIFTGIGRNRTTSSPASSEFLLTPSDSPLPLHAMGTTCKPLDETLMPSVQVTANPGLPASLPSTAATRAVRRVSAPIPSSSGPNSASLNTLALGVHFVLPPQPRQATGTGQELASSSLGLETNPVTLPLPPSHIDTSEPPRGRRPFWKPSFSRRTSIDMAQQSKHDKENASGTDSEATSSRFKRGRHSLSLARPSKVAVPPILTVPVESPTTPTPSDTTPTTPAASSPVTISRKSTWMEKRERSRSAERAPVKDRHARCAEIAHTAWGPATTEPGKRPRTPRAGSSSSIITSPAAPVAHATTSRPSRP
ncbi:hypothetical protein BKA62DRAFT_767398 [Auriculariales sp. MPI-PUGE-AT-0066]|nr:hypothetical protein BKA62DRAFT_767398 [Auriculariales sp. MPI-PUGE-AT-0066]